jgi:hypothetical protein
MSQYWCHLCAQHIVPVLQQEGEQECPQCHETFIELIEDSEPPVPPLPQQQPQQPPPPQQPFPFPFPPFLFNMQQQAQQAQQTQGAPVHPHPHPHPFGNMPRNSGVHIVFGPTIQIRSANNVNNAATNTNNNAADATRPPFNTTNDNPLAQLLQHIMHGMGTHPYVIRTAITTAIGVGVGVGTSSDFDVDCHTAASQRCKNNMKAAVSMQSSIACLNKQRMSVNWRPTVFAASNTELLTVTCVSLACGVAGDVARHSANMPPPADKKEVENLHRFTWSEGEGNCAVCKDDFQTEDKILQMPCHHNFHEDCLTPWLERV